MSRDHRPSIWVLNRDDNVGAVVGCDATSGARCMLRGAMTGSLEVRQPTPHGHKVALKAIHAGEHVIKYGVPVGRTTVAVALGEHVHVHNMESLRGRGDLLSVAYGHQVASTPKSCKTSG